MFEPISTRKVLRIVVLTLMLGALLVPLTFALPVRAEKGAQNEGVAQE